MFYVFGSFAGTKGTAQFSKTMAVVTFEFSRMSEIIRQIFITTIVAFRPTLLSKMAYRKIFFLTKPTNHAAHRSNQKCIVQKRITALLSREDNENIGNKLSLSESKAYVRHNFLLNLPSSSPLLSLVQKAHLAFYSTPTTTRGVPTVYEVDKDYWSLKTTIDDIRAKYGLMGGNHIKDPNLDQHSDLELEVDLTAADVEKLGQIQSLLQNAALDLERLMSSVLGPDGKPKKQIWLTEDDDVSGHAVDAIKSFHENRVAGDVDLHAYNLEEIKEEKPVGYQDFFGKK
ncbi:hypothetical protein G9A89_020960 [Geosiphon pyriformis]|nr:hypothetical protein G9A89_020960 [Geosiphon pyriformis]